jgi:hypothetical protein
MAEEPIVEVQRFVWVSIAGANPEPAGIAELPNGARTVYTIGCEDPFYPDNASDPCRILGDLNVPVIVGEAAKVEVVPATDETETQPAKAEKPKDRKTEPTPKGTTKKEPKPKTKAVPKEHSYKGWGQ